MKILVTGATGYIGGRLIPRLLDQGHSVRVLVRDSSRIAGRPWSGRVEVVEGDLLEPDTAHRAAAGMDALYYLVHSMTSSGDFASQDAAAARHVLAAAGEVRRVIYLGGLMPSSGSASEHLASRAEVGKILLTHPGAVELRAGPIIGSGSASFEMIRYLTERLPVMITPKWVHHEVRPIAIRDVLAYLLGALDSPVTGSLDIGAEPVRFMDMMRTYAEIRGLRRWILPVPVLLPGVAARWVGWITPIPNRLAVPLIYGIQKPLVGDMSRAHEAFPEIEPLPYRDAVERALRKVERGDVETRWSGALGDGPGYALTDWEGMIHEVRQASTQASPEQVFKTLSSLGGDRGWLVWNWAWSLRGFLDRVVGGPGLRRGRRHATELLVGESVDFWRVEAVEPNALLRLRAEMKLPGRAWLEFEVRRGDDGTTHLTQTARFASKGLAGAFYWYGLYPIHRWIFRDMIRAIVRAAEAG
ncbi:MAG: DUF2867 domain-containing protein [Kiritimatiellae bacterium]|nr:DUF2867 domain-containing protein [Kiritimatiellia bacterium]